MVQKRIQMMKRMGGLGMVAALLIIMADGCAPVYIPNAVNVSMFKEKGEAVVSGSMGTSFMDLQTAYAFSNHLAAMFSLSGKPRDPDDESNHFFVEGGLGYFTTFGKSGRLECFGGYGWGRADSKDTFLWDDMQAAGKYHRIFIQPSIGFATDYFEGAFSLRMAHVRLYDSNAYDDHSAFFLEPVLTGKAGSRTLKLIAQAGVSYVVRKQLEWDEAYQPFIINFGIQWTPKPSKKGSS